MPKNVDIAALRPTGTQGKLSAIKGFSLNGPILSNSFPTLCVILNSFQNLSGVMLNLFQHLKNFISRIGVCKNKLYNIFQCTNQVRNSNVMTLSVAFTLAETLITIGMIGVIAALTLPTLMNSTNEKEVVARVKKINATLAEAYGRAVAKYGPVSTWFRSTDSTYALRSQRVGQRMAEFLQVEKDCGLATGQKCFTPGKVKLIDNTTDLDKDIDSRNDMYKIILSDGTSIAFHGYPETFSQACIYIDTDGPNKGKHALGIDFFVTFLLNTNNVGPYAIRDIDQLPDNCRKGTSVRACTAWVQQTDNADYINCSGLTSSNPTCN